MAEGKYVRPTWDEYFMEICRTVAKRATCDRGRSGCVIARNRQILVTGYVGSPMGMPHCDDVGHQMKTTIHEDGHQTQHCVRTVHAEQNAIVQAANSGVSVCGGTLYVTIQPCVLCAKMAINAGIKKIVFRGDYPDDLSMELLKEAGIRVVRL